jgi:hypothetical protein
MGGRGLLKLSDQSFVVIGRNFQSGDGLDVTLAPFGSEPRATGSGGPGEPVRWPPARKPNSA